MIRRLLLFVALVGAGFGVLLWATQGGDPSGAGPVEIGAEEEVTAPAGDEAAIEFGEEGQEDGPGREVTVSNHGAFRFSATRTLVLEGNRTVDLPVYRLRCDDSRPLPDGRQHMFGLEVRFYDEGGTPAAPEAVHIATLTAEEAFAEVVRDLRGRRSLSSDKQIELQSVRLETTADAALPDAELTVGQLFVMATPERIDLDTEPDEPFVLDVAGEHAMHMTGRGLRARFPGQEQESRRWDLTVLSVPRLHRLRDGTLLRAEGELRYDERPARGSARLVMDDDVRLEMLAGAVDVPGFPDDAEAAGEPITVRGERLTALLQRDGATGSPGPGRASWSHVRLNGAPAVLTGSGFEVRCADVGVLPGLDGRPVLISATGANTRLVRTHPDGRTTTFTADRNIHLVRPARQLRPMLRAVGMPVWGLGSFARRDAIVFEGGSTVADPRGLDLRAEDGLIIFPPRTSGGPLVARGRGATRIERRPDGDDGLPLEARGGHGFLLVQGRGEDAATRPLDFVLGSPDPAEGTPWSLRHGDAHLDGRGRCRVRRSATGGVTVELEAPGPVISGRLADDSGSLRSVRSLDAEFGGEGMERFAAHGDECELSWRDARGRTVTGRAARVRGVGPDHAHFTGTAERPARLAYTGPLRPGEPDSHLQLSGPDLHVHRVGPRDLAVRAVGAPGRRAHLDLDDATSSLDLDAVTLRWLPYAVPSGSVHWGDPVLQHLGTALARSPVLLADGQVAVERVERDPGGTVVSRSLASGDRLVAVPERGTGRLEGPEAVASWSDAAGRTHTGRAVRIRFRDERVGESLVLEHTPDRPPVLELADTGEGGRGSWRITSAGAIVADPRRARCTGPAVARQLDADGEPDPDGLRVAAESLSVDRHPHTSEPIRVHAHGDARIDRGGLAGRAGNLDIDLQRGICRAENPTGLVTFAVRGVEYSARVLEANYRTFAVRAWNGTLGGSPAR